MKVFCIGRNYREHISELHHTCAFGACFLHETGYLHPHQEPAFLSSGLWLAIHYEVELVLASAKWERTSRRSSPLLILMQWVSGWILLPRDIQTKCKEKGLPWLVAKGFDNAAPLGKFIEERS
jgi:acylpyruvate hydrolase